MTPPRARHRPTEIEYELFTGFGDGGNGFELLDWVIGGGGEAWGDDNGSLYIRNVRRQGRNWLEPGDRLARRLRPDGTPTNDFYRLEPEVWEDAYDDLGRPS